MNRDRWTPLTTVVLSIGCLVSVFASSDNNRLRPEALARGVVGGVQSAMAAVGQSVGGTVRAVGELRQLRNDYETLLSDLEDFQRLPGQIQALEQENASLREQLGFVARSERSLIVARIIAREPGPSVFGSFTINRGSRQGIERGQAVIAYEEGDEGLVGRITEVSGGTSLVVPIFAPGMYMGARLDRSQHEGLVEGNGSNVTPLTMRFVPRNARTRIRYGDRISTSGLRSRFPGNIPIGTVARVAAPAWETSIEISLDPIVDFSRLEYVFVVSSN